MRLCGGYEKGGQVEINRLPEYRIDIIRCQMFFAFSNQAPFGLGMISEVVIGSISNDQKLRNLAKQRNTVRSDA